MPDAIFEAMKQSIIDGDPERAAELSRRSIAECVHPLEAINRGFVQGLNHVGEQLEQGELFLPDLVH